MALTDKEIRQKTQCFIGFGRTVDGPAMFLGPLPEDMPQGGTATIALGKKAQRRLLRELVAALSI